MKRIFAVMISAMMMFGLFAGTASATDSVVSPELDRVVEVSVSTSGSQGMEFRDTEFQMELDVSKAGVEDAHWEAFAKEEGFTFDAERGVLCFSLKAGEKLELNLPFGDDYALRVVGVDGHEEYTHTVVNGEKTDGYEFDVSGSGAEIEIVHYFGDPTVEIEPSQPGDSGSDTPSSPQTGSTVGILGLSAAAAASGAVAVLAGRKAKKG